MRPFLVRAAALAVLTALLAGRTGTGPARADDDDGTKLRVKEGDPAPEVTLPATQVGKVLPDQKDAKSLSLKDLRGKKNVVLYFFPKAATKG